MDFDGLGMKQVYIFWPKKKDNNNYTIVLSGEIYVTIFQYETIGFHTGCDAFAPERSAHGKTALRFQTCMEHVYALYSRKIEE